jgi:ACS family glucarate transporter-like MFS transporter
MNMLGNIGSAISAIIFPFFVARVSIPFLAEKTGTASSFFVFAAAMNVLAIVAWLLVKPGKKIANQSPQSVKRRFIIFIIVLISVTATVLIYKFLNS